MLKKVIIVSFFILVLCSYAFHLETQSPITVKKTLIHADRGWQYSGVTLKSEQYYSIVARGSWVSGYETLVHGPEGHGYGTINDCALVGWISDEKPPQLNYDSYKRDIVSSIILIRSGGMFKSRGNAKLWFAMGDWSGCKECSGSIEVLTTVYE